MLLPDGKVRKRRKNFNEAGDAHELTFCCFHGLPLLGRDRTRWWLVEALDAARKSMRLELWAYVIMPDHVHVLLYPLEHRYDMAAMRKAIKQSVARKAVRHLQEHAPGWLSRLEVIEGGRRFHRFWQAGGGYDRNIRSAKTAWASVRYIHGNPVRRGLTDCDTNWRWSSARWYAGLDEVALEMDDCPPDQPPS
jgi:putative transposase